MKADISQDKTRKRKEDVAADERLGDVSSVRDVEDPGNQTTFGDSAEPSEVPDESIGDALVDEGAEVLKRRLSPMEMRTSTPAGGLLYAGSGLTKCDYDALVTKALKH